jgi:hypothetical protein
MNEGLIISIAFFHLKTAGPRSQPFECINLGVVRSVFATTGEALKNNNPQITSTTATTMTTLFSANIPRSSTFGVIPILGR